MLKNFLRKQNPLKLGRWNITYDNATLEKKINWANHDHCGSEVCESYFTDDKNKKIEEVENWTKRLKDKKKEKVTNSASKKKDDDDDDDDNTPLYVPYCL